MALVIPRRLLTINLGPKLLKTFVSPYHCSVLTNPQCRHSKITLECSVSLLQINRGHQNTLCNAVRHFSAQESNKTGQKDEQPKLSIFQRMKQMYRDYWYVLVPVHLVTSAAWLGGFYYLATSGVDIPSLLESMNFNEKIVNSMRNSSMGYFAITYGLYKIATPARYAVTVGGTTLSINYLKKWGYIQPMPSKERLKEIYAETKTGMKEKKDNLIESVHQLQQTVKETKDGIKEKKDSIVTSVKESQKSIKNIKEKVIRSSAEKLPGKKNNA